MLRVLEYDSFEKISKGEWNSLTDKAGASVFQSFEWNELWWKHFGEGKLKILEMFDNEKLVGVGPFCEINGVLNLLGGIDITDYEDVIVLTEYKDVFIENISKYKYDFHFVPEGGNLTVLPNAKIEVEEVAPYIDLPDNFETYVNNLPRHDRLELRRKMRKLEVGNWRVEKARNGEDIDDFFRLHRESDTGKEKFMTSKMEAFFREMAKIFYGLGKLDLCYLVVDGKRVATTLSFKEKDRILAYNAGFDVKYGYLSVGLLCHVYAIKEAISPPSRKATEGFKVYDFLRGNERYKYQLGAKDKTLYHITTIGDK